MTGHGGGKGGGDLRNNWVLKNVYYFVYFIYIVGHLEFHKVEWQLINTLKK